MSVTATKAIPREVALQLCADIQAENRRKWYTAAGMMCRGCVKFSKGDPNKRCFASRPDNRGCYQVSARYDARVLTGAAERDKSQASDRLSPDR